MPPSVPRRQPWRLVSLGALLLVLVTVAIFMFYSSHPTGGAGRRRPDGYFMVLSASRAGSTWLRTALQLISDDKVMFSEQLEPFLGLNPTDKRGIVDKIIELEEESIERASAAPPGSVAFGFKASLEQLDGLDDSEKLAWIQTMRMQVVFLRHRSLLEPALLRLAAKERHQPALRGGPAALWAADPDQFSDMLAHVQAADQRLQDFGQLLPAHQQLTVYSEDLADNAAAPIVDSIRFILRNERFEPEFGRFELLAGHPLPVPSTAHISNLAELQQLVKNSSGSHRSEQ
jgi:hypothetical protein